MNKKNKGFTLVELLAVVVVLAIIVAIAMLQVNRIIKKVKKDANDINKKQIVEAVKVCMLQNNEEYCDDMTKLIDNNYLDEFENPYTKDNSNIKNDYIIVVDGDNVKVYGPELKQNVLSKKDAYEYFTWCNNNKESKCVNGLSENGKKWLKEENDVLVFPDYVNTINGNFSNVDYNIDAIIINNKTSVNADFSGSTINLVKIDSGSIGNSKFKNSNIKKLILGDAGSLSVGQEAFTGSTIDYYEIKKGVIGWQSGQQAKIKKLVIGKEVTDMGGNTFSGTNIGELVIEAENSKAAWNGNHTFRHGNACALGWDTGKKIDTVTIKESVKKLPKNMIANNVIVRYIAVGNLIIEGDKNRFSVQDLYDTGFNCDKIVSVLKGSDNEIDAQTCRSITNNGKITTENCKLQ